MQKRDGVESATLLAACHQLGHGYQFISCGTREFRNDDGTEQEAQRFWKLVVNSVMAANLFMRGASRISKTTMGEWAKAFSDQSNKRPPADASDVLTSLTVLNFWLLVVVAFIG
jgi:hypothetical protein